MDVETDIDGDDLVKRFHSTKILDEIYKAIMRYSHFNATDDKRWIDAGYGYILDLLDTYETTDGAFQLAALRYVPSNQEEIKWFISFYERLPEDITAEIIVNGLV